MSNRLATATKNYVVLDRRAFEELMASKRQREQLIDELREQLRDSHNALLLALHQLARERGVRDRAHFVRQWFRDWRTEEPPVPLGPKRKEGR